jgi:ribosomal protein S18 acetylase RimI-like enzyme
LENEKIISSIVMDIQDGGDGHLSYQCRSCRQDIPASLISSDLRRDLIDSGVQGDRFFDIYCGRCAQGNVKRLTSSSGHKRDKLRSAQDPETGVLIARTPLSWRQAVQLALYHLHLTAPSDNVRQGVKFFRWKEDICAVLEKHWPFLLFDKSPINNHWQSSVSSVLSSYPETFIRGNELHLRESGWWALRHMEPPPHTYHWSNNASGSISHGAGSSQRQDSIATITDKGELLKRLLSEDQSLLRKALLEQEERNKAVTQRLLPSTDDDEADDADKEGDREDGTDEKGAGDKAILERRPRRKLQRGLTPGKQHLPAVEAEVLRRLHLLLRPSDQSPAVSPVLRRLHRKLINRWLKRKLLALGDSEYAHVSLLDLDAWMHDYLRQNDLTSFLYVGEQAPKSVALDDNASMRGDPNSSTETILYRREPERSFQYRLMGLSSFFDSHADGAWLHAPVWSASLGRRISAFVAAVPEAMSLPKELALLMEIRNRGRHQEGAISMSQLLKVVRLRKELVSQVNRLLQAAFWPRIDVGELADSPECTLVLMLRCRCVGFVAWQPEDGYVPYVYLAPGFRGVGLGKFMMHLIIQQHQQQQQRHNDNNNSGANVVRRDLTLHVAPDNAEAVCLYQSLGFRLDRYVLGFYDKYLPADVGGSRNAFFMRLKQL